MTLTRRKRYIIGGAVLVIVGGLIGARLYLDVWALRYVNNVLANIKGYEGSVEDIDIDLYRGAYRIYELKVFKKTGNIPTPFIAIEQSDISIQWGALFHGRIVSDIDLVKPVITFAVNKSGTTEQTGAEVDWTKPIKDLAPIDINLVTFRQGKLSYQDFSATPKVNVYITEMRGQARNLRNVEKEGEALPSDIVVKGKSIGGGDLDIQGKMNILRPVPDMALKAKLVKVNLPALSDYSNAYAAIDIKGGRLDVYSEFNVKNNQVSGYVKPIATKVSLIDLRKPTNPLKLAWELLAMVVVELFTNQPRDQFATKVELQGELGNVDTNIWSTVSGIVRNAFFEAVKRGFDNDDLRLEHGKGE